MNSPWKRLWTCFKTGYMMMMMMMKMMMKIMMMKMKLIRTYGREECTKWLKAIIYKVRGIRRGTQVMEAVLCL
jgi:hypothetical protein